MEFEKNDKRMDKDIYNTKFIKSIYIKHMIVDQRINDISRSSDKGLMRNSSEEFLKRYEQFYSINLSLIPLQMKKDFYLDNSCKISFPVKEKDTKFSCKLDKKEFLKVLTDYEQSEDKCTSRLKVKNERILSSNNSIKKLDQKKLVISQNNSRNKIISHTTKNSANKEKILMNISNNETVKNKNNKPQFPKYCKIDLNVKSKKTEIPKGKNNLEIKNRNNINSRNSKPTSIYTNDSIQKKTNSQFLNSKLTSFKGNYSYNIKESILNTNSVIESKIVNTVTKINKAVISHNNSKKHLKISLKKTIQYNLTSPKRD